MDTRLNDRGTAGPGLPDLLTVEEAAHLMRVGRTKAYAMAREWRDTGGRSGLPVVDFGHVLRVPRRALEILVGAELTASVADTDPEQPEDHAAPTAAPEPSATAPPATAPPASRKPRPRQRRISPTNQLDLFKPPPAS